MELRAELLLGHSDEEISNDLWNGLSDGSDGDAEDGVDSGADFPDEKIYASWLWLVLRLWLLALSILDGHAILVELDLGGVVSVRHNRSSILLVVSVVDKEIVLL